ncbi:MAG TPA: copper resistance protein CopC [Acidimicrobiales bacterium]|nr:copper resistance protein CopC [Acidimicrobiales bacterium]
MKRVVLAAGLVLFAVVGLTVPAFAHAVLQSTDPPSGAVLQKSPGTVVLHFGEDVEIQFGAVRVFNAGGKRVDSGNSYHPRGDGHAVATNVPSSLGTGGYVVTWRVISADSHPVHGAFTFQIGAGGAATAQASKAEATKLLAAGGGSRTVGVVFWIIRFVAFGALFVLVGGTAFVAGIWPAGSRDRRARQLLWGSLIAAVVTTALAICIQGPYGGGLPLSEMVKPSVVSAVLHTRFGQVSLARLIILVAVALPLLHTLLRSGQSGRPRWWTAAAVVTGAAILITPGLAGHAGAGSLIALAIPFDLVHVAGASIWVGGLAVLAVAVLSRHNHETETSLRPIVTRYSQIALLAVLAIAVTGGFAAWRQVGTWAAVTSTTFGRLLLAKTIIFAVLVTVASFSRQIVHGNLALPFGLSRAPRTTVRRVQPVSPVSPGPGAVAATKPGQGRGGQVRSVRRRRKPRLPWPSRLRWTVLGELALAAGIVGVTAGLVNAQPARSALRLPYSTEVHAGSNVLVDVVIDPATAGPVALHLYTLSPDGAQLDVPEVAATFSLPAAGISGLKAPLQKAGPGHFLAYGFDIPLRGAWTLQLTVRTTNIDEFNADPITVRMR